MARLRILSIFVIALGAASAASASDSSAAGPCEGGVCASCCDGTAGGCLDACIDLNCLGDCEVYENTLCCTSGWAVQCAH